MTKIDIFLISALMHTIYPELPYQRNSNYIFMEKIKDKYLPGYHLYCCRPLINYTIIQLYNVTEVTFYSFTESKTTKQKTTRAPYIRKKKKGGHVSRIYKEYTVYRIK